MIQRSLCRPFQAACRIYRAPSPARFWRTKFAPDQLFSLRQQTLYNYYSTTETSSDAETVAAAADSSQPSTTENTQKTDSDTKDKEITELKDRYLRSVADFRNLQDRTKRDIDAARNFAISRFAADLLESVDNLDRAIATVPVEEVGRPDSNKDLKNLHDGLKMTENILMQTLKKHGLERFDPSEDEEQFNPNLHEATFQTKVEGKANGTVFTTMQKGFTLNGRVVRAAKVGVVKNN